VFGKRVKAIEEAARGALDVRTKVLGLPLQISMIRVFTFVGVLQ
jgi:hypothetical protein